MLFRRNDIAHSQSQNDEDAETQRGQHRGNKSAVNAERRPTQKLFVWRTEKSSGRDARAVVFHELLFTLSVVPSRLTLCSSPDSLFPFFTAGRYVNSRKKMVALVKHIFLRASRIFLLINCTRKCSSQATDMLKKDLSSKKPLFFIIFHHEISLSLYILICVSRDCITLYFGI